MKNKVSEWIGKLSQYTWTIAIRQGLVSLIPILLIGAFALTLQSIPISNYLDFIQSWKNGIIYDVLNSIYNVTFGLLALHITVSVSLNYAILDKRTSRISYFGIVGSALAVFFLLSGMNNLSTDTLGPKGMFVALISAIGASILFENIFSVVKSSKTKSYGIDVRLSNSIRMIIPTIITVGTFALINYFILSITNSESVQELVILLINKLFSVVNNDFITGLLYVLLSSILWFFGIHGSNVLEGVASERFIPATDINVANVLAGQQPTEILTKPFFDVFVLMGGCGSAICLLIALFLFSKSKNNRRLANMASLPMFFNINEMMVFGLPIIYNPILLIPFLGVPLICFCTSYLAMATGLVPVVCASVEWTTPIFIGGYLTTDSIAGIGLQLINIIIGIMIYRPFIIKHEKETLVTYQKEFEKLVDLQKENEKYSRHMVLSKNDGIIGNIAKSLAYDLENEIKNKRLFLHYQPLYTLEKSCFGAEALLRWEHPSYGYIYPPLIIKLAEETEQLENLEMWIFEQAISDAERLWKNTKKEIRMNINITGSTIQNSQFFEIFLLKKAQNMNKNIHICIEITEQSALYFDDALQSRLLRLKEAGYELAIDDFSMGNTSLQYLQKCDFNMIKLDGGIVKEVLKNSRCKEIITSIVELSKNLNVNVLAEYVSNEELRDCLASCGCTLYQGWYYAKDMPYDELEEILSDKK